MDIGISSWTFPWAVGMPGRAPRDPLTPRRLLDRAGELGVRVVQLADNMPLHRLDAVEVDDLAAEAQARGLRIELGMLGIERSDLLAYLRLANRIGAPFVRVVIDTVDHHPGDDEVFATLRSVLPHFQDAGVALLIENHDRLGARSLARLLAALDSPALGICLDTVNSLGCLETVETVLDAVGPWVRNVHVKDFTIERTENRMGFVVHGAPVGQGALDVEHLVRRVRRLPHDANLILELWPPDDGSIPELLARETAWARTSIACLRRAVAAESVQIQRGGHGVR